MNASAYVLPPNVKPTEAVLVRTNDTQQTYTMRRDFDARTAITTGLAGYMQNLDSEGLYGRTFGFYNAFAAWAEPEAVETMPSVAVYSLARGEYDASQLTPHVTEVVVGQGDPVGGLLTSSELVIDLIADIWCVDPLQRSGLVGMLEDAFVPVEWRYGFLLDLPFYFNERASYELMGCEYLDSEDASQQRIRRAQMTVRARMAVSRPITLPRSKPRVKADVGPQVKFIR